MHGFDPVVARARLLELVRDRAYKDGLDIVLASGKRSTFYIQGKKITLDPEGLFLLAGLLLEELQQFPDITAIGGLTMGADPIAAAISALSFQTGRNLKAFLVRKEAKGHGVGSQIEGELAAGEQVAIIEDTITTGGSARKAIDAVLEIGAEPVVVLALADREDEDAAAFRAEFDVRPVFGLAEIRGDVTVPGAPPYDPIDPKHLAPALGRVVSGLYIVTCGTGAEATGFLGSWVQQAGFEPPAVTVAIHKDRAALAAMRRGRHFCVSVLSPSSMHHLKHFAKGFEPDDDPFDGVDVALSACGVPYLSDAHAHLTCRILGETTWSDHVIFCGEVVEGSCESFDENPATHVRKNGLSY